MDPNRRTAPPVPSTAPSVPATHFRPYDEMYDRRYEYPYPIPMRPRTPPTAPSLQLHTIHRLPTSTAPSQKKSPTQTQPPPLPPRPIMLAPPRGTAIMQTVPPSQRAPYPRHDVFAVPNEPPYPAYEDREQRHDDALDIPHDRDRDHDRDPARESNRQYLSRRQPDDYMRDRPAFLEAPIPPLQRPDLPREANASPTRRNCDREEKDIENTFYRRPVPWDTSAQQPHPPPPEQPSHPQPPQPQPPQSQQQTQMQRNWEPDRDWKPAQRPPSPPRSDAWAEPPSDQPMRARTEPPRPKNIPIKNSAPKPVRPVVKTEQTEAAVPPAEPARTEPEPQSQPTDRPPPERRSAEEDRNGSQRRQLKVEDALAYLEKVKTQFGEQLEVYNLFLDIMKEFKAQSIDTTEVIKRVSQLFRGHKDLILGFNTFLPPGYMIEMRDEDGQLMTGYTGPSGFKYLPSQRGKAPPKASLTSRMPTKKRVAPVPSPKRKETKVKTPPAITSAFAQDTIMDEAERKDGTASQTTIPSTKNLQGSSKMPHNNLPISASQMQYVNGTSATTNTQPSSRGQTAERASTAAPSSTKTPKTHEFERAIGFVTAIKERFSESPETYDEFLEVLSRFREERKGIREVFEAVAELFGPHKDLLNEFKEFLPTMALGTLPESKMKTKVATSVPRRPVTSKNSAQHTPSRRGAQNGSSRHRRGKTDMQFFEDIKAQLGNGKSRQYTEFIKCLSLFSQSIVTREELLSLTGEILRDLPEAQAAFLQYLDMAANSGDVATEGGNQNSSSHSSAPQPTAVDAARVAMYKTKPMSEIAAESDVMLTESYKRLPSDFPEAVCTGRSPMERKTLNDHWVSVTTGSEDYSFKFMRKNPFEDNLFRCEDDRYEIDLVIETNAATIMKLEEIVATISKLPLAEKQRHTLAQEALSPIHFNAIRRIYREHASEVILQLKTTPARAVPPLLERMKKKDISWRRARLEMNRVWRDVGERNYHRSLDHRSPHFKQSDKKELSAKTLFTDILDPVASMAVRDQESARSRGYTVSDGAGGPNEWSRSLRAVYIASLTASAMAPKSLHLPFEDLCVHKVAFDLIKKSLSGEKNMEHDGRRIMSEFGTLLERLYDIDLSGDKCTERSGKGNAFYVLYGDDNMYLLFRLYHILFERLMAALVMARSMAEDVARRKKCNEVGFRRLNGRSHLPRLRHAPSCLSRDAPTGESTEVAFSVAPKSTEPAVIFEMFLALLGKFVRGKLDAIKYEDRCRSLLGTGSYCLFTLDKTLSKTAKQVALVFGAESASRGFIDLLHEVHKYIGKNRENGGRADEAGMEALYSSCAAELLSTKRGSGQNLYRFENVYIDEIGSELGMHVLGKSCTEEDVGARMERLAPCEKFVGFGMIGPDRNDKSRDKTRKRKRVHPDFVRFARKDVGEVMMENRMVCRIDDRGRMRFLEGGGDFLQRKRWKMGKGGDEMEIRRRNEESEWTKTFRMKFKLVDEGSIEWAERDKPQRHDDV